MTYSRILVCLLLLSYVFPGPTAASPTRHALLIGIGDYSGTDLPSLKGVYNDISLMQDLLTEERFGFGGNITVLLDRDASHSAIEQAFQALAQRIQTGDQVYIHYSGHGSFTRDLNGDETSGEDQTWVSYGARRKGSDGLNGFDILDDELNQWLVSIFAKAEQVVLVSDSCHSASVTRGASQAVRAAPRDDREHPLGRQQFTQANLNNGIIIGAAGDKESASEFVSPADKNYGRFTWHWGAALEGVKQGETWGDLFKRAAVQVTRSDPSQSPQIKGNRSDETVFGGKIPGLPARVPVKQFLAANQTVSLPIGFLAGVTPGSTYRLFDPDAKPETVLPSIKITSVEPSFSIGSATGIFTPGDLVVEEKHAYIINPLPVAVAADFPMAQDQAALMALRAALLNGDFPGYTLAPEQIAASMTLYVVRPPANITLQTLKVGSSLPVSSSGSPPEVWVLTDTAKLWHPDLRFAISDMAKGKENLKKALATLAKAREVLNLSSEDMPHFEVKVTLWQPVDFCDHNSQDCLQPPDTALFFKRLGDHALGELALSPPAINSLLTFTLKNRDDLSWYAYLVEISPAGQISAIFPPVNTQAEVALIQAGETRDTRDLLSLITCDSGQETLKLIVSRKPIDVAVLEQDRFIREESRSAANPLENLLIDAVHGTRSGSSFMIGKKEWGTENFSFMVEK